MDTLSVRPRSSSGRGGVRHTPVYPEQMNLFNQPGCVPSMELHDGGAVNYGGSGQTGSFASVHETPASFSTESERPTTPQLSSGNQHPTSVGNGTPAAGVTSTAAPTCDTAQNELDSLYSLARLLKQSGKYLDATDDVLEEIVKMIREYVGNLKRDGKYEELVQKIMEFQMKSQGFAEYARQNPGVGRIQLIRMSKDAVGHSRFKRLDMAIYQKELSNYGE